MLAQSNIANINGRNFSLLFLVRFLCAKPFFLKGRVLKKNAFLVLKLFSLKLSQKSPLLEGRVVGPWRAERSSKKIFLGLIILEWQEGFYVCAFKAAFGNGEYCSSLPTYHKAHTCLTCIFAVF